MKSEFRATSAQDSLAVAAFLQRIFHMDPSHPTTDPRCLYWKYWEECPKWSGSRSYAMTQQAMAQQDTVTAHGCVVPLAYQWGDRRLNVVHLIDWAADPKSVGSGIILLKRIGQLADAIISIGGSEMTQKILPAFGFKTFEQITRYVLPLRPLRQVIEEEHPSWKTGAKFLRSLVWSLQAPSGMVPGWEVCRIAPEKIASAAIPWPKPSPQLAILERSGEMMRYFLKCPAAPMEFYTVAKQGTIRGYFILAYAPAQARLVDFWMSSEDPADWRVLVQLAVHQARQNQSVAEVVSVGNDAVTRQSLLACGFHARGSDPLNILASKGCEFPGVPVRIQMLDGDAAYLNNGHSEFWA